MGLCVRRFRQFMNQTTIEQLEEELRKDIVAMLANGIRALDVALEFGMSERQVYRIARDAGQKMMYRTKRRALLLHVLRRGGSYKDASEALGIKPESAYRTALRERHRLGQVKPRSIRSKT